MSGIESIVSERMTVLLNFQTEISTAFALVYIIFIGTCYALGTLNPQRFLHMIIGFPIVLTVQGLGQIFLAAFNK